MERKFAVIENNKVVNIIVGASEDILLNPTKYIEYTNGWDYNNGIDGGVFFPPQITPEPIQ